MAAGGLYIEAPGGIYSESLKNFINAQMNSHNDAVIQLINAQVDLKFKGVECIFFFRCFFSLLFVFFFSTLPRPRLKIVSH